MSAPRPLDFAERLEVAERRTVVDATAPRTLVGELAHEAGAQRPLVRGDVLDEREAPRAPVKTIDTVQAREVARELVEVVERPVVELTV